MKALLKRLVAVLLLSILAIQTACAEKQPSVYHLVSQQPPIYELADTGWLVEYWSFRYNAWRMKRQAQTFNEVMSAFDEVKTYVFLINSSRSLDLDHLDSDPLVWTKLKDYYPNSTLDSFQVRTLEDYQKYYYKTDHHWNYIASYEGYTQIIRMLLGEDEPLLKPVETVEFPVMFNGSYNKDMNVQTSDEPFTVYRFDYPQMTVKVNEKWQKTYGRQTEYFAGRYSRKALTNHYMSFYGGDKALVSFNTNQPDRENILVFSNSFSNAVDMLIASHFNRTYFVDQRYYVRDLEREFNLSRAVKEWNISKVLLLGDGSFFSLSALYR